MSLTNTGICNLTVNRRMKPSFIAYLSESCEGPTDSAAAAAAAAVHRVPHRSCSKRTTCPCAENTNTQIEMLR